MFHYQLSLERQNPFFRGSRPARRAPEECGQPCGGWPGDELGSVITGPAGMAAGRVVGVPVREDQKDPLAGAIQARAEPDQDLGAGPGVVVDQAEQDVAGPDVSLA